MIGEQPIIRWRSGLALAVAVTGVLAGVALARSGRLISFLWMLNLALPILALGAAAALRHDWAWTPPARLVMAARVATAALASAGAFWFFGGILSWGDPRPSTIALSFGIGALYLLPAAITPFLGRGLAWLAKRTLLMLALTWLAAYGWLRVESSLLIAGAAAEGRTVHVQRHWPFGGSSVSYSPQHGVHWHD
jgi:hypothetical protein